MQTEQLNCAHYGSVPIAAVAMWLRMPCMSSSFCLYHEVGSDAGRNTPWCICWVFPCFLEGPLLKPKGVSAPSVSSVHREAQQPRLTLNRRGT